MSPPQPAENKSLRGYCAESTAGRVIRSGALHLHVIHGDIQRNTSENEW